VRVELYQLSWCEVPLRKYEGEEVSAPSSAAVPELVNLDEDENTRAQCDRLLAVIARSRVAAEIVSMISPLA